MFVLRLRVASFGQWAKIFHDHPRLHGAWDMTAHLPPLVPDQAVLQGRCNALQLSAKGFDDCSGTEIVHLCQQYQTVATLHRHADGRAIVGTLFTPVRD